MEGLGNKSERRTSRGVRTPSAKYTSMATVSVACRDVGIGT